MKLQTISYNLNSFFKSKVLFFLLDQMKSPVEELVDSMNSKFIAVICLWVQIPPGEFFQSIYNLV